jgi:hypothetical protein
LADTLLAEEPAATAAQLDEAACSAELDGAFTPIVSPTEQIFAAQSVTNSRLGLDAANVALVSNPLFEHVRHAGGR